MKSTGGLPFSSSRDNTYLPGYGVHVQSLAKRTASTHARFVLPLLKRKMRILDCGCGPGSITATLSATAGCDLEIFAVDFETRQIIKAKETARSLGTAMPRFAVADVLNLPFADCQFDLIFAHTLLLHLRDPIRALQEMKRTLKANGVVAVREEDQGTTIVEPMTNLMRKSRELYLDIWKNRGGNPYLARRYKSILKTSGFDDIQISASATVKSRPAELELKATVFCSYLTNPSFIEEAQQVAGVSESEIRAMASDWMEWARRDDALFADLNFEAIARKQLA